MSERIARSSRVFLIGVVVACGIEVAVDWNQTLFEINVFRNAIRQKGESYVGIIGKASDDELAAGDRAGLERLTHGIFDDEDAIYVRFTDAAGKVVWDRLKADLSPGLAPTADAFVQRYGHAMARDTQLVLHDPETLKTRVANSRYKDFAQSWTDAMTRILGWFSRPKAAAGARGVVIYQDRLRDEKHQKDDRISYAIGTVLGENGKDVGTVIVAFDMARTNAAVRRKYMKFAGLVTFFVGLILVQNVVSRRNKLRLLNQQTKFAAAKAALREAMPAGEVKTGNLVASGAVDQARGPIDGMLWCAAEDDGALLVLVIDPDGDGIDAAVVGLHVSRRFLQRRAETRVPLGDELRALGDAACEIPLTRPLAALLVRVDAKTGAYEALGGTMAQLRVVGGPTVAVPSFVSAEGEVPDGVVGPLRTSSGVLAPGTSLVAMCTDEEKLDGSRFADGIAAYLRRTHEAGRAVATEDAAIWARGKNGALADCDIGVVAVARGGLEAAT